MKEGGKGGKREKVEAEGSEARGVRKAAVFGGDR